MNGLDLQQWEQDGLPALFNCGISLTLYMLMSGAVRPKRGPWDAFSFYAISNLCQRISCQLPNIPLLACHVSSLSVLLLQVCTADWQTRACWIHVPHYQRWESTQSHRERRDAQRLTSSSQRKLSKPHWPLLVLTTKVLQSLPNDKYPFKLWERNPGW